MILNIYTFSYRRDDNSSGQNKELSTEGRKG